MLSVKFMLYNNGGDIIQNNVAYKQHNQGIMCYILKSMTNSCCKDLTFIMMGNATTAKNLKFAWRDVCSIVVLRAVLIAAWVQHKHAQISPIFTHIMSNRNKSNLKTPEFGVANITQYLHPKFGKKQSTKSQALDKGLPSMH